MKKCYHFVVSESNYKFSLAGKTVNNNFLLFLGTVEIVRDWDVRRPIGPQNKGWH
jgi:hypothetical protein